MTKGRNDANHPNRQVERRRFSNHGYETTPAGFTSEGKPTFQHHQIGHANAEWNRRGEAEGLEYPTLANTKRDVPNPNLKRMS
jgi:hypothetical protein